MKNKIDLHTHTTASDGSYTPKKLVKKALAEGFTSIAITDHDTINGLSEAEVEAKGTSLNIIRGCELSTSYNNTSVHVLGLFLPQDLESYPEFTNALKFLQDARTSRNRAMLDTVNDVLKKEKIITEDITWEEVKSKSCGENFGRGDFAATLVDRKLFSKEEVFDKYLGKDGRAYVKRAKPMATQDAVKILSDTGALVVIAHPVDSFTKDQVFARESLEALIEEVKPLGLNALEAYHSQQSSEDTKYLIELAAKHDLLITGGSDFHGERKENVKLGLAKGDIEIPYEILERLQIYNK